MSVIDVIMRLTDQVTAPLTRIRSQMDATAKTSTRLGRTVQTVGKNIGSISSALMPVSAGLVAAGTMAATTFMDFDRVITGAGAKAGASAAELEKMRAAATQMGADFPVSATEVAQAMDALAASGFNANQTVALMPSILTSAVASGEGLAQTSQVVTSALNIWGMAQENVGQNAARVADVIQQAANASALGLQDFGIALQYAGAPAAALNVNIEELSTALALIKNRGIDASTAGTSLRSLFTRLSNPPKQAAEAIAQLGLQVTDSAGNFIGLENVISQMRSAMQGLNDTQRIALAQAIAGTEGYSALLSLVDTAPEEYRRMTEEINNAAGSSTRQYEIMKNTLSGSVEDMKGSLEALAINFGSVLAPSIRQAAAAIGSIADAINAMSPEQKAMLADIAMGIVGFTGFAFAAGKVVSIGGSLVTMYGNIATVLAGHHIRNKLLEYSIIGVGRAFTFLRTAALTALPRIGAAFTLMLSPVGLAVAGVIAAGYLLYRNWDTVKQWITGVLSALSNGFSAAFDMWRAILMTFLNFVASVFVGGWNATWNGLLSVVGYVAEGTRSIFGGVLESVRSMFNGVIDSINGIQITIPAWVPGFGGSTFGPLGIPKLATGADSWRGGPAMIHDRGAEIVDLPTGTRVIPHDASITAAYNMGARNSSVNLGGISVNISGVTVQGENDIQKLADKVAAAIYDQLQKRSVNLKAGAV
ncbi:MAG TPA: phage tail tape measure protein [Candidatus Phascolarctobacterium stercoravium]|nr:phage tail tape measure protein [Candidatus Phascolarctobacterium stercoravium]